MKPENVNNHPDEHALLRDEALAIHAALRRKSAHIAEDMLERALALLETQGFERPYHDVGPELRAIWDQVRASHGEEGFDQFQRLTFTRLIAGFEKRAGSCRYTPAVRDCFHRSYRRILRAVMNPGYGEYRTVNDRFLKDLGLASQRLFPAGVRVIDPDAGYSRALFKSGGVWQAIRFLHVLVTSGGHRHWYYMHVHPNELGDFTPRGWTETLLRLADMLELNPDVRGICGGSWFYDPVMSQVSPHLAYIREIPTKNGASVFYVEDDPESGALSKSARRRDLYEKGAYVPRVYALIWPRRAVLRWARHLRKTTTA